jgi:SAM-dependent methyltransferase
VSVRPGHVQRDASLLASQRTYDDARADKYGDESKPDRNAPGLTTADVCRALIEELWPTGDVLELACGTGSFTREIVGTRIR